jgi:hypothetical protein
MTDEDPVAQAISLLKDKRYAILSAARDQANAIEIAISTLEQALPSQARSATPDRDETQIVPPPVADLPPGASVRMMMQALLDEEDRDWSSFEILQEYQRRGRPIHGKDPDNALRAALADAHKAGRIERTAPGRYKSMLWRLGPSKGGLNLMSP